MLRVPSAEETLRIKGFLIVGRNQTRDYLDVAALADRYGVADAAAVLAARWSDWNQARDMCGAVASAMVEQET
ncbi:MAG: hypothetical protein ACRDRN_03755 [Sciscionella sp.]